MQLRVLMRPNGSFLRTTSAFISTTEKEECCIKIRDKKSKLQASLLESNFLQSPSWWALPVDRKFSWSCSKLTPPFPTFFPGVGSKIQEGRFTCPLCRNVNNILVCSRNLYPAGTACSSARFPQLFMIIKLNLIYGIVKKEIPQAEMCFYSHHIQTRLCFPRMGATHSSANAQKTNPTVPFSPLGQTTFCLFHTISLKAPHQQVHCPKKNVYTEEIKLARLTSKSNWYGSQTLSISQLNSLQSNVILWPYYVQ